MRVAICDDERAVRDHYSDLIKLTAQQKGFEIIVDRFEKGSQLLFAMEDKKLVYDIIFLDIFMPGESGIEIGAHIRDAELGGFIVYLTRSQDHMLHAFDMGAENYVVKGEDYSKDRFEKVFLSTVERVEEKRRKFILLNSIEEHRNVALDSIQYFEVNRHICLVRYGEGESFEFSSSLGRLEAMLLSFDFERVHKSFLVNCLSVKSYTAKEITMNNGDHIPLGRKYAATFREAMAGFAEINATKNTMSSS